MDTLIGTRAALLQALVDGDSYGLELIDIVRERTGGAVVLLQGAVYPALRALERKGLVESHPGEARPERGGRPRRYYRLTAEGARAAQEQRRTLLGLLQPAAEALT